MIDDYTDLDRKCHRGPEGCAGESEQALREEALRRLGLHLGVSDDVVEGSS